MALSVDQGKVGDYPGSLQSDVVFLGLPILIAKCHDLGDYVSWNSRVMTLLVLKPKASIWEKQGYDVK